MLSKLLKILALGATLAPAIITDTEGVVSRISADTGTLQKVHDGLDAALEALGLIQKVV